MNFGTDLSLMSLFLSTFEIITAVPNRSTWGTICLGFVEMKRVQFLIGGFYRTVKNIDQEILISWAADTQRYHFSKSQRWIKQKLLQVVGGIRLPLSLVRTKIQDYLVQPNHQKANCDNSKYYYSQAFFSWRIHFSINFREENIPLWTWHRLR